MRDYLQQLRSAGADERARRIHLARRRREGVGKSTNLAFTADYRTRARSSTSSRLASPAARRSARRFASWILNGEHGSAVGGGRSAADVRGSRSASRRGHPARACGWPMGRLRPVHRRHVRLPRGRARGAAAHCSTRSNRGPAGARARPHVAARRAARRRPPAVSRPASPITSNASSEPFFERVRRGYLDRAQGASGTHQGRRRGASRSTKCNTRSRPSSTRCSGDSGDDRADIRIRNVELEALPVAAARARAARGRARGETPRPRLAARRPRGDRQAQPRAACSRTDCSRAERQEARRPICRPPKRSQRCATVMHRSIIIPTSIGCSRRRRSETISVEQVRDAAESLNLKSHRGGAKVVVDRAGRRHDELGGERASEDARGTVRRQLSDPSEPPAATIACDDSQPLPTAQPRTAVDRRACGLARACRPPRSARRGYSRVDRRCKRPRFLPTVKPAKAIS